MAYLPSTRDESRVGLLQLDTGERWPVDLVILAIGSKGAAPTWLSSAKGVKLRDGRVEVDERGQLTGMRQVFAIGEVLFPPRRRHLTNHTCMQETSRLSEAPRQRQPRFLGT